jgi:hypothetical protein
VTGDYSPNGSAIDTAIEIIREFGNEADAEADRRAVQCENKNDPEAAAFWSQVAQAVRLLTPGPSS